MAKPMCIIDRFEGEWAVVEFDGKTMFNLPKSLLPSEASEGDVLCINIQIDSQQTEKRKQEIEKLTKGIFVEE